MRPSVRAPQRRLESSLPRNQTLLQINERSAMTCAGGIGQIGPARLLQLLARDRQGPGEWASGRLASAGSCGREPSLYSRRVRASSERKMIFMVAPLAVASLILRRVAFNCCMPCHAAVRTGSVHQILGFGQIVALLALDLRCSQSRPSRQPFAMRLPVMISVRQ